EVVHVLGDGGDAQVVFAAAFGERKEEGSGVFRLHHPPGLVDDQKSLLEPAPDHVPDVVGDDVHRHTLQFILHVTKREYDELLIDIDVGRLVHETGPGAGSIFLDAGDQRVGPFHSGQYHLEIG